MQQVKLVVLGQKDAHKDTVTLHYICGPSLTCYDPQVGLSCSYWKDVMVEGVPVRVEITGWFFVTARSSCQEEGQKLAAQWKAAFFEVSCENVDEAFAELLRRVATSKQAKRRKRGEKRCLMC
ncbi:hypothetical protein QOT17_006685 [Balamuthia mandrillaris]